MHLGEPSPQSGPGLPRSGMEAFPSLGAGAEIRSFCSFPTPLSSQWPDCHHWGPLLSSWEPPQGLAPLGCANRRPCGFPRLPCHAELLFLLLVSCSNDWIISGDVTLQWRNENGAQPTRRENWSSQPPGVFCYLQNYVT